MVPIRVVMSSKFSAISDRFASLSVLTFLNGQFLLLDISCVKLTFEDTSPKNFRPISVLEQDNSIISLRNCSKLFHGMPFLINSVYFHFELFLCISRDGFSHVSSIKAFLPDPLLYAA